MTVQGSGANMERAFSRELLEQVGTAPVGCCAIAGDRDRPAIAYFKGGWFCQSAHFNRGGAGARKRTVSAHA